MVTCHDSSAQAGAAATRGGRPGYRSEPHHYLSLLGTHPDHRGAGHGMRLLADNLELIDGQGMPAYLESTNPADDARYGRLGFEPVGSFEGFLPGSTITALWRPARR